VFLKERRFYQLRNQSAYLVNHIFGLRMYFSEDQLCTGCPPELMEKVTTVLKDMKINYIIVDHDELEEQEVFTENTFTEYQNLFLCYERRKEFELKKKKEQEWSQEQVDVVVHSLEHILKGVNSFTEQELSVNDIMNGPVHDILSGILIYFVSVQKYGFRIDQKAGFSDLFYIDRDKAISMLSGADLKISEFAARMNEGKDAVQRKRLGAASITSWLLTHGYLEEVLDEQNRKVRISTSLGQSIGIKTQEQKSQNGTYRTNWYSYDAQRFLIDHLMMF